MKNWQLTWLAAVVLASIHSWAAAQQPAAATSASSSASVSAGSSQALPEVTIKGKRELEARVRKFVNGIAVQEDAHTAGLARWGTPPICPLVSGLTRQRGEFILERLSEIAREAGVPLAGERCRTNLYVLVTPQPEDLLRGMEKRNRPFTFGYDGGSWTPVPVVDEFIKTPHAVRVWYNSDGKDRWGMPLGGCGGVCDPTGGSHLLWETVWTFSRVFVIVDQKRLQGVELGQLADYVAMVGFAKLKPEARLGDAPTILKLFDGDPRTAPTRMTGWDQAFLKSLYATEQMSKLQRGEIARDIVRDTAAH